MGKGGGQERQAWGEAWGRQRRAVWGGKRETDRHGGVKRQTNGHGRGGEETWTWGNRRSHGQGGGETHSGTQVGGRDPPTDTEQGGEQTHARTWGGGETHLQKSISPTLAEYTFLQTECDIMHFSLFVS